jgi:hypothetical protein
MEPRAYGSALARELHDHGIRQLQDFEETARYLLDNPARVGLVADSDTYPWRGGVLLTGYEP